MNWKRRAAMISGGTRMIFFSDRIPMIDVFFDKLNYNHPIDYKNRLEINPHCVSLTDLLLQKLQIVQINDKDLKDGMLLLLAASLKDEEANSINIRYLCKIMSDDWGFYHTATTNLQNLKLAMPPVKALAAGQRKIIETKIDQLAKALEETPKSGKWKNRARIGTSKPWYNEVADWA